MRRRSFGALGVVLALAVGDLIVPAIASAATFTTSVTCSSPSSCGSSTTNPAPSAGNSVTVIGGGNSSGQIFVIDTSGAVEITDVTATFSDGGSVTRSPSDSSHLFTGISPTHFVSQFDVTWNDTPSATSTTVATTTTTVASGTTTSVSTSSTSSTTSTTSSTTTTTTPPTTLPPGPGALYQPRPEGGLDRGVDATAVRGDEQVHVAVVRNGSLQETTWTGSAWTPYRDLGNPPTGAFKDDPSIISWAPGRVDVFVRGADDKLWQRVSTDSGQTWSDWLQPVGTDGVLASGPDVGSRGENRLDVFVVGTDGHIYQRFWEGVWNDGWLDQGAPSPGISPGSHPTALSMDGVRVDVYVRGSDDKLWQKWWTGDHWSEWLKPVGDRGVLASSPDATSWDDPTVAVFVVGTDGHMYAIVYGTGGWAADWIRLGRSIDVFQGSPGADSRGAPGSASARFDVFGRGTDGALYQLFQ